MILDGMRWLDLGADEGPYFQTQRYERYRAVIAQLLERGARLPLLLHQGRAGGNAPAAARAQGKAALRRALPGATASRDRASSRPFASRTRSMAK